MANIFDKSFDEERTGRRGTRRLTRIGASVGSDRIGATIWELEPGATAYRYHYHYGEEELLIVLEGRPTLRVPDGSRELDTGEVVSFLVGPEGAHQLVNNSDEIARFITISAGDETDVIEYPDTEQTAISYRRGKSGGFKRLFSRGS